jgi:hypothetical protein
LRTGEGWAALARAIILAISDPLSQHAAYFDAKVPA